MRHGDLSYPLGKFATQPYGPDLKYYSSKLNDWLLFGLRIIPFPLLFLDDEGRQDCPRVPGLNVQPSHRTIQQGQLDR